MLKERLTTFNERCADRATDVFGSMGMFWLLLVYSSLGAIPRLLAYQPTLLYWSNAVQLVALPLLGAGAVVQGRRAKAVSDANAAKVLQLLQETHDASMAQMTSMNEALRELHKIAHAEGVE